MLDAALAYCRMGLRVFPLHTIVNGRCSCSRDPDVICASNPPSPGKHPRVKGGFKAATDDSEQIRRWWTKQPDSNIGIATGSGIAVIDIDGEEGAREFKSLVETHGPLPVTLLAKTGNGWHAFYSTQRGKGEVRSTAVGKVHTRGEGGYVVGTPSRHISGRAYEWIKKVPIAPLPDWVRQWSQGYKVVKENEQSFFGLGQLPAHLQGRNTRDINASTLESLKTVYSPAEHARIASALQAISAKSCSYDDFLRIGMALKELDWERSDGTSISFELWDAWCSQSDQYNPEGLQFKWNSFRRSGVTPGSLYHMARERGWTGGAPAPAGASPGGPKPEAVNGHHATNALPAAFLTAMQGAIHFPDINEDGKVKATCTNAGVAVTALGISCQKDLFHEKMLVGGEPIQQWAGDLSDDVIQIIRKIIRARFGFDPNKQNTTDACIQLCLEHQFDPVLDYLDPLRWDGTPRLDTWMSRYMGAPDNELNRAIGRLSLIAAVRRARAPGTKFDQIIVLEGTEGRGKSTAIEILAGAKNFSDQKILGLSDREQQEAMTGIWLYEIAEMTGMRRADTEHVKAFASRTVDRARPAYGRFRVDRPRRAICFATTNDDEYLKSETGNRRFWPVVTSVIDLDGLRRDRDQLWAEATMCEARGDAITLPERLWKTAGEEQDRRRESDNWFELVANYLALNNKADVSATEVLCDNQFIQMRPDAVKRGDAMRAGAILKRLGYSRYHKRIADGFAWRYRKV